MLNFSTATRVFVATAPVDLRASFNRLFALTESILKQDPLSGHWFVFTNQERNRVKILFWDGSGLWVCAKRLEKGRFRWPETSGEETKVVLSHEELALLLGGIDLADIKRRQWYRRDLTPVINTQISA